ncbi:hypothetical protein HG535_0G02730 [Zygotorulaspora mrakii]|uniref:Lysophospholipase n=1 Tax=Zygotorulaspora mrakii TaxID=42260 RepID=A0A7H9B782_ZYGMR|nr:uncharacterized protein HG535_0G02730 [Zygotorulaspora mrakii]QLG74390.1 hypothetical protein HG535_0G02730 [Zygotorulaspora mrakii]
MLLKNLLFPITLLFISLVGAWSPSNGYAPSRVSCDNDTNLIREANGLSANETDWLQKRDIYTRYALKSFLTRANNSFSNHSIISELFSNDSNVPKIGIACSGGGYRAMLSGAGMIAAMDNRTGGALDHGLGGLLQSSTYLAGLSGGSWLVGSLAWNNWTSVQDIINSTPENDSIWDLTHSIASPGGVDVNKSAERWEVITEDIMSKAALGFPVTLADYWGRALSYNFFPSLPDGGVGYTWSSLRDSEVFTSGQMPFPISVADFRSPYTTISSRNSSVFEFNPFEIGSWESSVNAFSDIKYLGTQTSNGVPVNKGQCVEGFDNAGFIMGTSSTLFNPSMSPVIGMLMNGGTVASIFQKAIANDSNDVANYAPNPFKDVTFATDDSGETIVQSDYLYLADGGEDGETIPLVPLLQQDRDLDVIFALDSSSDTITSWPDGSSLVNTYERQFSSQGKNIAFPYVPDQSTFEILQLNKKPTFFGCDARNLTDLKYIPPLVVYIPNTAYSFNSNQSTFKMSYTPAERLEMMENGFEAATMGNFTHDPEFMTCIGCAIIRRKQQSFNATLPEECDSCFSRYCWSGELSENYPGVTTGNQTLTSNVTSISSTATLEPSITSMSTETLSISSATASPSSTIVMRGAGSTYLRPTFDMKCLAVIIFTSGVFGFIL